MSPRLYVATNGLSVWYSDNLGDELQRTPTAKGMYSGTQAWGLACHPANTGEVLCGTELGLFRFDPAGKMWSHVPSAMDQRRLVTAIAYSPHAPGVVLAGTQTANLYRSKDGGNTWVDLRVPMHKSVALEFLGGTDINNNPKVRVERGKSSDPVKHWTRVCQITFDPDDPNLVCACVEIDDAWVSHDGGHTFERRNEGLHAAAADVHGMAVVNNGGRKLFATTAFGLHMSDDDGRHWTFHKLEFTLAIHPQHRRAPGSSGCDVSYEWQRLPRMARAALSQPRLWRDLAGRGPTGVCAKLGLLFGGQSRRSDAWVRGRIVGPAVSHDRWRRDLGRAAPAAW